jgi:hypothetical protein
MLEHLTVSAPTGLLMTVGRWLLPPRVVFGSPVQRGKDEAESFWHIPIKIARKWGVGPGTLSGCIVYLDACHLGVITEKVRLPWGDAVFQPMAQRTDLENGEAILVPIASRSEKEAERNVTITSLKFFVGTGAEIILSTARDKFRFRLRVKSGDKTYTSEHFYLIRVPSRNGSNGHFVCEIEYEGGGKA